MLLATKVVQYTVHTPVPHQEPFNHPSYSTPMTCRWWTQEACMYKVGIKQRYLLRPSLESHPRQAKEQE